MDFTESEVTRFAAVARHLDGLSAQCDLVKFLGVGMKNYRWITVSKASLCEISWQLLGDLNRVFALGLVRLMGAAMVVAVAPSRAAAPVASRPNQSNCFSLIFLKAL
jgi:hypothetical protein